MVCNPFFFYVIQKNKDVLRGLISRGKVQVLATPRTEMLLLHFSIYRQNQSKALKNDTSHPLALPVSPVWVDVISSIHELFVFQILIMKELRADSDVVKINSGSSQRWITSQCCNIPEMDRLDLRFWRQTSNIWAVKRAALVQGNIEQGWWRSLEDTREAEGEGNIVRRSGDWEDGY